MDSCGSAVTSAYERVACTLSGGSFRRQLANEGKMRLYASAVFISEREHRQIADRVND